MQTISVVVPTLNRAELLARTIDHIQSQTVSRDRYEVIVVDKKATRLVSTAVKQDRSAAVFYHFITGCDKRAIDGFRNPKSHRTTRAPHCAIGCREIGGVG